jgi:NADPH:quinone reductase-like Zn-dependent oxidoreductase
MGVGSAVISDSNWVTFSVSIRPLKTNTKEAFFIVEANRQQLMEIAQLIGAGVLRPIVSEVLRLGAAAQAYFPTKKANPGKTVLRLSA